MTYKINQAANSYSRKKSQAMDKLCERLADKISQYRPEAVSTQPEPNEEKTQLSSSIVAETLEELLDEEPEVQAGGPSCAAPPGNPGSGPASGSAASGSQGGGSQGAYGASGSGPQAGSSQVNPGYMPPSKAFEHYIGEIVHKLKDRIIDDPNDPFIRSVTRIKGYVLDNRNCSNIDRLVADAVILAGVVIVKDVAKNYKSRKK